MNSAASSGEFHMQLLAVTGNGPLIEFLRQLVARSSLVIAVYGFAGAKRDSCRGHEVLLDLLEAQDAAGVGIWMDQHLRDIAAALKFDDRDAEGLGLKDDFAAMKAEGGLVQAPQ